MLSTSMPAGSEIGTSISRVCATATPSGIVASMILRAGGQQPAVHADPVARCVALNEGVGPDDARRGRDGVDPDPKLSAHDRAQAAARRTSRCDHSPDVDGRIVIGTLPYRRAIVAVEEHQPKLIHRTGQARGGRGGVAGRDHERE